MNPETTSYGTTRRWRSSTTTRQRATVAACSKGSCPDRGQYQCRGRTHRDTGRPAWQRRLRRLGAEDAGMGPARLSETARAKDRLGDDRGTVNSARQFSSRHERAGRVAATLAGHSPKGQRARLIDARMRPTLHCSTTTDGLPPRNRETAKPRNHSRPAAVLNPRVSPYRARII